jgi:hypothetical protein
MERLNTERQVLWLSYDVCREKEGKKSRTKEKMEKRQWKIIQLRYTGKNPMQTNAQRNLNIQTSTKIN